MDQANLQSFALRLGNGFASLAHIIPDDKHAGMWRIKWRDGSTSDMVNLDRAKDAARAITARKMAMKDHRRFRWVNHSS